MQVKIYILGTHIWVLNSWFYFTVGLISDADQRKIKIEQVVWKWGLWE